METFTSNPNTIERIDMIDYTSMDNEDIEEIISNVEDEAREDYNNLWEEYTHLVQRVLPYLKKLNKERRRPSRVKNTDLDYLVHDLEHKTPLTWEGQQSL